MRYASILQEQRTELTASFEHEVIKCFSKKRLLDMI